SRPGHRRRIVRHAGHRQRLPVGADRGEGVDDGRALRARVDLVGLIAEDPPGPARPDVPDLLTDPEADVTANHDPALLVRVAVLRHDRIRGELDDGEGQLLALDAARDDALPDPDRGDLGELDEVRHRDLRSGRPHGRRSVEPTRDRSGGSVTWSRSLRASTKGWSSPPS